MDPDFDDTVTAPRRPMVAPILPADGDLDDTVVPGREPAQLIEQADTAPIPVQEEQARPFFRYRIGRTVVWLDAVSYVGRRPSSPRIVHGQMPRLVRVPSPGHEVSSTHVELRQLGSSVVITDMRSTNGSTVFPPGVAPHKLRQGESVVVTPGTLVDIGDGNVIEILPLQLRAPGEPPAHIQEGSS